MTTPAEYREIGEECLQAMRGTTSPEVRAELLRLALQWEDLAEAIERRGHLQVTDLIPQKSSTHAIRRHSDKYSRLLKKAG